MSEPKQIEIDINPQLLEGMLLRLENTKWPPTIGDCLLYTSDAADE